MIKNYVSATTLFFIGLFVTLPANAQEVPANKTSEVGVFFVYNESTCGHIGKLKHFITRKPKNGRIDVNFERRKIKPSLSTRCAGRTSSVMVIRYTPNSGYRGRDAAKVVIRFPEFNGDYASKAEPFNYKFVVK
jgi:hypothetical protein